MSPELEHGIEAFRRASQENTVTDELLEFVDVVADLARDSMAKESADGRRFLEETAKHFPAARVCLGQYIEEAVMSVRREFYDDEWRGVCERRSKIEFVRSLYRDVAPVDWDGTFMEVDELDYAITQKGSYEGTANPASIPAGTPKSHWWWWYPDEPAPPTLNDAE